MVGGKGKEGVEKVECNLDSQKGQVMRGISESGGKKQKNKQTIFASLQSRTLDALRWSK